MLGMYWGAPAAFGEGCVIGARVLARAECVRVRVCVSESVRG